MNLVPRDYSVHSVIFIFASRLYRNQSSSPHSPATYLPTHPLACYPAMLVKYAATASARNGGMAARPDLTLKPSLQKLRDYRAVHREFNSGSQDMRGGSRGGCV